MAVVMEHAIVFSHDHPPVEAHVYGYITCLTHRNFARSGPFQTAFSDLTWYLINSVMRGNKLFMGPW